MSRFLDELDDTRRAKLEAMLADPEYTNGYIARGLEAAGCRTNPYTVRNHRAGTCCRNRQEAKK